MPEIANFGIYIHWPYCARICPYCDFNVYKNRDHDAALVAAIITDIKNQAEQLGPQPLTSVHFGGGTPSLLPPADIEKIIDTCLQTFPPKPGIEIGLEANPTDHDRLADIRAAGIERLSLGVQALDNSDLKRLGRDHTAEQAVMTIKAAKMLFPRLSVDVINGRENQTPRQWQSELQQFIEFDLSHISVYGLTIEDGTSFAKQLKRGQLHLPPDNHTADMFTTTHDMLTQAGFAHYEISNFATADKYQSQHNRLYWESADWLGVGPGAHGRLTIDGQRTGTTAARLPRDYIQSVKDTGAGVVAVETLTDFETAQETLIMGLRLVEGVAFDKLATLNIKPSILVSLAAENLIEQTGFRILDGGVISGRLALTGRGRSVLDHVLLRLLG